MSRVVSSEADRRLVEASRAARASFRFFWRELSWEYRRIAPALDLAIVRFPFSDPGHPERGVEQLWVGEVQFDGRTVVGAVMNRPNTLESVHKGTHVERPLAELTDWLLAMDEVAYGAFTVQAQRADMDQAARRAHDEAWALDFGDPAAPRVVPQKSAQAAEHPMAANLSATLDQALTTNPALLTATNRQGLTLLQQLALAGTKVGVGIALAHGARRDAQAPNGMTALDMARALGWTELEPLLT